MRKIIALLCFTILASSCKSSKKTTYQPANFNHETTVPTKNVQVNSNTEVAILDSENKEEFKDLSIELVDFAKQFEGVRYKFGGTTDQGMDCSGLVFETFKTYNIELPRSSRDMANEGVKIKIDDVKPGDLLFFHTNPKRKTINHVGLVVSARTGHIEFIHSTTRKGVITSSLAEHYWYYSFTEARRIL